MPHRITAISPSTTPPKPYRYRLHIPGGTKPTHELYIDMSSIGNRRLYPPYNDPEPVANTSFLSSIRDAVANDKNIDVINIHDCTPDFPDDELWGALAGAQPTHLELSAGALEYCKYAGLSAVQPAWPLKSLYLAAYEGDGRWRELYDEDDMPDKSFPACYSNLEALVLHCPSENQLYFFPEGGASNLRSLTIIGNNAVATFAHTVRGNPLVLQTLRSLTISCQTYQALEGEDVLAIHTFLHDSKALLRIELLLNDPDHGPPLALPTSVIEEVEPASEDPGSEPPYYTDAYVGLADSLPSSLESLSLRAPANTLMLKELDKWTENARKSSWLPGLRTIAFKLDLPNRLHDANLTEAQEKELGDKVREMFDTLKQRKPAVKVVEPRPHDELQYPLTF